ncbi:hypothetical protein [Mariniflexile sp. HMF6888]|uniref:hypothetical protein n=1 Tax=Mariniflexile sp. HMF6888 TaxID=3373086 RepID=UPI00379ABDAC
MIKRAKVFNQEAAVNIIANKHGLRPISQSFIDGLLNEAGTNLSDSQELLNLSLVQYSTGCP